MSYHLTPEVLERFWAQVDKRGPDDCWEWQGRRHTHGYGEFSACGFTVRANRLSLMLAKNITFKKREYACHTCDNPSCVNPAHLWVGTPSQNLRDARQKKRIKSLKLLPSQVSYIKLLISEGFSDRKIAPWYCIHHSTVYGIRCNQTWWEIEPAKNIRSQS